MYSDDLKGLLELNKNITSVWIDANGDWHTHEVANCEEVSREDILKPTKKVKKNE